MLLYQSGQLTSTALSGEINLGIENNSNQVTQEVWNNISSDMTFLFLYIFSPDLKSRLKLKM